jgi:toxin YoeB
MRVLFTRDAWTDYLGWQESSRETAFRVNRLIDDIQRSPFRGLGKPEPLRGNFAGWWSRRIASDHRLVYRIVGAGEEQQVEIMSCRFHYSRRS